MDNKEEMPVVRPYTERRNPPDEQSILFILNVVHDKIESLDNKLTKHIHDETLQLAEEVSRLMLKSFPEGDPDGHRAAHEAWIRREESKTRFWEKMVFEITRWGVLGVLGWMLYHLWKAFIEGPK